MNPLEATLSGDEMAVLLRLTDRRVRQLAVDGTIERDERGSYRLHPSVGKYIETLENKRDPEIQELNKIRARMARMDLAKRDGTLISLDEALGSIDELSGLFVSSLGRLPAMLAKKQGQSQQEFLAERNRLEDIIDEFRTKLLADIEKLDAPGQPAKPVDDE
ncbi:hypothetical protein M8994_14400 [Brucella sp. 21LCYQ03]|nr:hypothetical protein [Brucella sp. 21LCYQ03]